MAVVKSPAGVLSAGCCLLLLLLLLLMHMSAAEAPEPDQNMELRFLRNVSVTCNDGSPAG